MANIIDATYFIGDISIAQVASTLSPTVGDTVLSVYIPQYEYEYLVKALGYAFATAFIEGIAAESIEQKWTDLKNGKIYTYNDKTYKWDGFSNDLKQSPIAQYIYIGYMQNQATQTTGAGEGKNKIQNMDYVTNGNKIWKASFKMNDMNKGLYHFLNANTDTYTEYDTSMIDMNMLCGISSNAFNL